MKESTRVFLELLENDLYYHADDFAKRVRSALPKNVLASMTVDQHQALIAAMREGMEFVIWSFLGHFDNVGCHLPDQVLGYSILARIPDTNDRPDIREGQADYADMWSSYLLDHKEEAAQRDS